VQRPVVDEDRQEDYEEHVRRAKAAHGNPNAESLADLPTKSGH
jgi:hypothetical protein